MTEYRAISNSLSKNVTRAAEKAQIDDHKRLFNEANGYVDANTNAAPANSQSSVMAPAADEAPYDQLYIYYLEGRLNPEKNVVSDDFLGNWEEDDFSFLFFSRPADALVAELIDHQPQLKLLDQYNMPYAQWQGGRQDALRIGRFLIAPPWLPAAAQAQELGLVLDPGVVFGNGTHATTLHCLEALQMAFSHSRPSSLLDLGTGTGVLALAAARLGCPRVLAVDFNQLAVRTAQRNIALNHLDSQVLAVQGLAQDLLDSPCEGLVANIHYDVMRSVIAAPGFLRKRWFILSGLLRSEARSVSDQLALMPVHLRHSWQHEGVWHTLWGECQPG